MKNAFLTGEKIYLRTIDASDITPTYQSWFNDPEVCRFNDHHRFPMYQEEMQAYYEQVIRSRNNLVLAIVAKAGDIHIGNISLQNIDTINRSAEFAIVIGNKDWWGKGIAKEAGACIIRHGFSSLNLHRIYCGTSRTNLPMQKVAEAIGFREEGVLREAIFKDGQWQDMIQYGLLSHEYES